MSHSQFHRIEAHTEAYNIGHRTYQKTVKSSWPQSVDLNAELRLTKCMFGLSEDTPPFQATGHTKNCKKAASPKVSI